MKLAGTAHFDSSVNAITANIDVRYPVHLRLKDSFKSVVVCITHFCSYAQNNEYSLPPVGHEKRSILEKFLSHLACCFKFLRALYDYAVKRTYMIVIISQAVKLSSEVVESFLLNKSKWLYRPASKAIAHYTMGLTLS